MIYGPNETPVAAGPDGHVKIERTADELFKADTIASFNGKPLIKGHPRTADGGLEFVSPKSWKDLTVGIIMNPRRGADADDDVLLGDILVTDAETIEAVKSGHPEVSAGYDSNYFQIAPGHGQQRDIIANHVAIVPYARCGPRCAIGDHAGVPQHQEKPMKTSIWQRLKDAFTKNDSQAFEAVLQEAQEAPARTADCGEQQHVDSAAFGSHVQAFNDHAERNDHEHAEFHRRLSAVEGSMKKTADAAAAAAAAAQTRATADSNDEAIRAAIVSEVDEPHRVGAAKAVDSRYLADSFSQTVAGAEILMPGVLLPEFSEEADPKVTFQAIDGLRRKTLDAAYLVPETRALIDRTLGGKPLETAKLSADETRTLFNASVELRRQRTNSAMFADNTQTRDTGAKGPTKVRTPADINRLNAERFGAH